MLNLFKFYEILKSWLSWLIDPIHIHPNLLQGSLPLPHRLENWQVHFPDLSVDLAAAGTSKIKRSCVLFSSRIPACCCLVVVFWNIAGGPTRNPLLQPFQWLCKPLIHFLLKLDDIVSVFLQLNPDWYSSQILILKEPCEIRERKV